MLGCASHAPQEEVLAANVVKSADIGTIDIGGMPPANPSRGQMGLRVFRVRSVTYSTDRAVLRPLPARDRCGCLNTAVSSRFRFLQTAGHGNRKADIHSARRADLAYLRISLRIPRQRTASGACDENGQMACIRCHAPEPEKGRDSVPRRLSRSRGREGGGGSFRRVPT